MREIPRQVWIYLSILFVLFLLAAASDARSIAEGVLQ